MPSVGMRRSTRVFGARVLRSGRRLWSAPGDEKHTRAAATAAAVTNGEEWIELLDNSQEVGGGSGGVDEILCKQNGWRHDEVGLKQEVAVIDIDEKILEPNHKSSVDRMWGSVYQRKRNRIESENYDFEGSSGKKKRALESRKYGKQFIRKQWRRKESRVLAAAVVESSSCSSPRWFACFLGSVLSYMRRARLRLLQLSAFVLSEPLAHVFSSHGIHFLQDSHSIKSSGICTIFGARCSIPLFAVDFSAIPLCFMELHSGLLLRSAWLSYVLLTYSNVTDDSMIEVVEPLPCISSERESPGIDTVTSRNSNTGKRTAVGAPRLTGRAVQFRRSTLRSRRTKNPSVFRGRKANGTLVCKFFGSRHDDIRLAPVVSDRKLRSSVQKTSILNIKELKSSLVGLTQNIGSTWCSANILVIESDKCYRIKGSIIKLEISASNQWFLAVKKDGITVYGITAQKVMRPCSCNRVTHDIIWTEDTYSWKLEFPDRRDWLIFKELYKECSARNVQAPSANILPVPGVHEVSGYVDSKSVPFRRPNSYISVKDDELSRALTKRTANYDMDSEDEEWLRKFNNDSSVGNEQWKHVSEEIFELIIDVLEKAFFCHPDDYSDEKPALNLCLDLERKEVVESVYSYCMKKRKLKRSALVRVFQCYQPRRDQLLPTSILRKKRSFKRQASRIGRGKQRTFLQAMAAEQDAVEEQKALLRVQEAKDAASRSEGLAVSKRQRAQLLMENADLVTYKATMALRMAEAAQVAESAEAAASFFLQ